MTPETPETTVAEALADFDVHDSASRDRLDTAADLPILGRDDALAVCGAVASLESLDCSLDEADAWEKNHAIHMLLALFQQADDEDAVGVLREQGIPELVRLVDAALEDLGDSDADAEDEISADGQATGDQTDDGADSSEGGRGEELPEGDEQASESGEAGGIDAVTTPGHSRLMFALKILSLYGTPDGLDRLVDAAHHPKLAEEYLWHVILSGLPRKHPVTESVAGRLVDPLPPGFAGVATLDLVNALLLDGADMTHTFQSDEGLARIEGWLRDKDEENFSYAVSAAAALPFLERSGRDRLFALAWEHSSPEVQLEAAYASARIGGEAGIKVLVRWCEDPRYALRAMAYLEELDREDALPACLEDEDYLALAHMTQWLMHPNEYGSAPDRIEMIDCREMFWPPVDERRVMRLFRYEYDSTPDEDEEGEDGSESGRKESSGEVETDVGIGLVGSVTFSLFGESTPDMTPEQLYGLHCAWELEIRGDPRAPEERTAESGQKILDEYNDGVAGL